MSWWGTGITAAVGVYKGVQNEKKMEKNDKARKAAIMYSPWTGMGDPGSKELPGVLDSGIQGGLTGAMIGSAAGSAAAPSSTAAAATPNAQGMSLGAAEQGSKLEGLQFSPEEMKGLGPYSSMGQQQATAQPDFATPQQPPMPAQNAGSPGALGVNPQGGQPDDMRKKYSYMKY